MKITMILFGFFPSDVRVRKEALTLTKAGHNITVLCCAEESMQMTFSKVRVPRVGKYSDWKGKLTVNQLLKFWILSFHYLMIKRNFDILHCHDLTGLVPAVWYKLLFPHTEIVYDSHEIYPESVREKLGNLITLPFLMLEKFCVKFVNKIIGISLPQKKLMQKRYNIKHFLYIPNFPSKEEFFAGEKSLNEKIIIIYSGGILRNRGYEQLVEAVSILSQKRDDFLVQLVGDGPFRSTVEEMVKTEGLEPFIEIVGNVHYYKVRNYLINADIGIALYQPTPNNDYGLSNKIFEYIACELPLIYPYYKGSTFYLKRIGGINVNPTSSLEIAQKIEFLIKHPEIRDSIRTAEKDLRPEIIWESVENKLIEFYKSI